MHSIPLRNSAKTRTSFTLETEMWDSRWTNLQPRTNTLFQGMLSRIGLITCDWDGAKDDETLPKQFALKVHWISGKIFVFSNVCIIEDGFLLDNQEDVWFVIKWPHNCSTDSALLWAIHKRCEEQFEENPFRLQIFYEESLPCFRRIMRKWKHTNSCVNSRPLLIVSIRFPSLKTTNWLDQLLLNISITQKSVTSIRHWLLLK